MRTGFAESNPPHTRTGGGGGGGRGGGGGGRGRGGGGREWGGGTHRESVGDCESEGHNARRATGITSLNLGDLRKHVPYYMSRCKLSKLTFCIGLL